MAYPEKREDGNYYCEEHDYHIEPREENGIVIIICPACYVRESVLDPNKRRRVLTAAQTTEEALRILDAYLNFWGK